MPAKERKRKRLPLHGERSKLAKRTPARARAPKSPAKKRAPSPSKQKRAQKAGKKAAHKRPKPVREPVQKRRKKVAPKPPPKPSPKRRKSTPKPPPKRRKSTPKPAPKRRKAAPPKPAPKAPKRRKAAPPKPAPKPAPKAPKAAKAAAKAARSDAAKRGWAKRRVRKKLLDKMADIHMRKRAEQAMDDPDAQPLGWLVRRANLREIDGKIWRRIAVEFSESAYQSRRLEVLRELEIDLLPRGELYDYLSWAGDHFDIDLPDMYQMYLGYSPGAGEGEG